MSCRAFFSSAPYRGHLVSAAARRPGYATDLGPPERANLSVPDAAVPPPAVTTAAPPALRNIRRFDSVIVVYSPRRFSPRKPHGKRAERGLRSTRVHFP